MDQKDVIISLVRRVTRLGFYREFMVGGNK